MVFVLIAFNFHSQNVAPLTNVELDRLELMDKRTAI